MCGSTSSGDIEDHRSNTPRLSAVNNFVTSVLRKPAVAIDIELSQLMPEVVGLTVVCVSLVFRLIVAPDPARLPPSWGKIC